MMAIELSKYDFRRKLHHTKFSQYQYFFDLVAGLLKSGNKKASSSHFFHETVMQYRGKMVRFKTEMTRFKAKNRVIRNKSHSGEPIRLQGSPMI